MDRQALLLCDSGWVEDFCIGQGHLFRCRAFAAHLEAIGWCVRLLELSISEDTTKYSGTEQRYSLSLEKLRNLRRFSGLSELSGAAVESEVQLLLIDSYQLPLAFYESCVKEFQRSHYLALDDFERFGVGGGLGGEVGVGGYPKEFFILQAALPLLPGFPCYLRGLQYQVLRPEFGHHSRQPCPSIVGKPYSLLVPGSAFSLRQVQATAAALRQPLSNETALAVLLSPRQTEHSEEIKAENKATTIAEGLTFLANLNAAELRSLYIGAQSIYCVASQSLLEILAVSGPHTKICVLLTADNQLPLLQQYNLPHIDLRAALAEPMLLEQALEDLASPNLLRNISLPYLGDGLAMRRILQKMGLQGEGV